MYKGLELLIHIVQLPLPAETQNVWFSKILLSLDRCSMGIYIVHHIILVYLLQYEQINSLVINHYMISPFILFILLLFISWGMVYSIQRTPFKKLV